MRSLDVLAWAAPVGALAEVDVLLVLCQVCVQAHTRVLPGQARRLYHELGGHIEGRAGRQRHAQH